MISWPGDEQGLASVQALVGFTFAVVVLVLAANVVAMQYTRGALRSAAAGGARAGAAAGGTVAACEARGAEILRGDGGLLRGPYASDARVECRHEGQTMAAEASAGASWWLGVIPPVLLRVGVEAVVEELPPPGRPDLPPSSG